jgi:hypothetical protein
VVHCPAFSVADDKGGDFCQVPARPGNLD